LIKKFPQEAAVLRGTEGISVTCCDRTALLMLHRRCHVAQRRKSDASNDGAVRLVAQLIKMTWLVAALEIERGNVGHQLPVLHAAELPLIARNGAGRAEKAITHGERVRRAGRIERRISRHIGIAPHVVERVGRLGRVRREGGRYPSGDRLSLIERGRGIERHQSATARNVELPSHPPAGIAFPPQEPYAEIALRGRCRRRGRTEGSGVGGWVGYGGGESGAGKHVLAPGVDEIE